MKLMAVLTCPYKERIGLFSLPKMSLGRPVIPHVVTKIYQLFLVLLYKNPSAQIRSAKIRLSTLPFDSHRPSVW